MFNLIKQSFSNIWLNLKGERDIYEEMIHSFCVEWRIMLEDEIDNRELNYVDIEMDNLNWWYGNESERSLLVAFNVR